MVETTGDYHRFYNHWVIGRSGFIDARDDEVQKVAAVLAEAAKIAEAEPKRAVTAGMAIPENRINAASNLGGGPRQIMTSVVLHLAIPGIVTGARLAMGNSFLTIVSVEIVAAQHGLGALIWQARNYGRIDWSFVGIIALGLLGLTIDRILRITSGKYLARYGVKS